VSARDKRRVEQELKAERRQAQAQRESKNLVEARERAERDQRQRELVARRLEERAERERLTRALAREEQVDQILSFHAFVYHPGPQPFWHRTLDGRFVHRLDLPERLAQDLRSGRAAVAARRRLDEVDYVIVPRDVALRLTPLSPERVVFQNLHAPDPEDQAEKLLDEGER
jgi:uncharacterized protein YaiL (DUF2058 family)